MLNKTVEAAYEAWPIFSKINDKKRGLFLRTIADEIEELGEKLIATVSQETGLPKARVTGERGRTCGQLRLFAALIEEGSWVEATIDGNIKKMLHAVGPVAVFGASNFPLAFSTAGGDTASALAAGCPVIVKAHPAHLETHFLVAQAISNAVKKCDLPIGTFSSLEGGIDIGQALVAHPLVKAVGFTGSFKGGTAILRTANNRPEPIPVYAEMGSTNPVFIFPNKLANNPKELAEIIANSVNLGAGQFCTNPGLLFISNNEHTETFLEALKQAFSHLQPAKMLNPSIFHAYEINKEKCLNTSEVKALYLHQNDKIAGNGYPGIAVVEAKDFIANKHLQEEVFGPFTLVVLCNEVFSMERMISYLPGQLTGTIIATDEEILENERFIQQVTQKVGRLIFNGVPTGVEVCAAMHHGGPFPASSNSLFTSVGVDAIKRFARPIAYQNAPDNILPDALKADNPLNIWRTFNGTKIKQ